MMGGLRYHDRHQQCYFIEQGNENSFYENMLELNQFIKQEWIEKGNIEIEFEQSEMRIVIVLDNASYHKKQEVITRLSEECPNLELWFLPPYRTHLRSTAIASSASGD